MSESVQAGNSPREREEAASHVAVAFRKYLPPVFGAMLSVGFSGYLLLPLFEGPPPGTGGVGVEEDYSLDCFLVRDASGSVDPQHYARLEEEILSHLSTNDGDRISYSRFGSDVIPGGVQPPSDDGAEIASHRQHAEREAHTVSGTTDFERLFDRLREAIRDDRDAQKATKREPHADAVIILSDGIPDLTPDQEPCLVSDRELISDAIVQSYDAMINNLYPTREAIYVRLILVGAPPGCGPRIKQQWERRLGSKGLEVLSYSQIGSMPDLGGKLLKPLRRHPRILLRIAGLEDQERRKLDRGERFSVRFTARSFLRGGSMRIESASLVGQGGAELQLHALKNFRVSPTEDGHKPVFSIPSPEPGKLLGAPVDREEFYLESESSFVPLESETYRLLIKASVLEQPGPSVEVDPAEVPPCNKAGQKSRVRERLKIPAALSAALAGFFVLGVLAWLSTGKLSRVHAWLEGFFVLPYRRWIYVFLLLLVPLAVGIGALQKPWPMTGCLVLILGSVPFLLERFKKTLTVHLVFRVVESAALPLATEVAAQYLL